MKISYNWLKDFVDFPHNPTELGVLLDSLGLGVDGITEIGADWTNVLVGKVLTCEPVPNSDHLSLCTVDVGLDENPQIICGAPNVEADQTVPVAVVGAVLPGDFKITRRKLRGLESSGMICSEKELGISSEAGGIWVLPDDLPLGTPLAEHIGKQDWIFDLEVTFNRPDCLSQLGVAREISAATGIQLALPPVEVAESSPPAKTKVSVEIQAPDRCPRYSARIMEGVTVKPSPLWMQERLRAVGIRPINNVVDVTNYILMETGHPLHAFDYHLVHDGRVIVRMAKQGEKFTTLDEKEHVLDDTDLLIADPEGGIALAGVMGGLNSEIKDDTCDVLLECAYFEPVSIRVTSRDRGISTESSHRFERGVDPELTLYAVSRAARLIKELAGGEVLTGIVDNYAKPWQPVTALLRPERANKLLATNLDSSTMVEYLIALGCTAEDLAVKTEARNQDQKSQKTLDLFDSDQAPREGIRLTAPSWRHDLTREIDYIEEIARLYGYENIETATHSSVSLIPDLERERERKMVELFRHSLVESGFHEISSFSLIAGADLEKFPVEIQPAIIKNPISEDMAVLRPTLGPSLLKTIQNNSHSGEENVRLFEWGKCFWQENGKIREEWRLSGVLSGLVRPESWLEKSRDLCLYDLKGVLEQISDKIMLDNIQFICYHIPKFLLFGGAIFCDDHGEERQIGWFGQILPEIADRYDLDKPVWFFEINGDLILQIAGKTPQYQSLSKYPPAYRDLALVVEESVSAGEIEKIIYANGGELLIDCRVFDLFRGGNLPSGKKSLGFHLTYRSAVRTLSDSEVDQSVQQIIKATESEVGAVLRSI